MNLTRVESVGIEKGLYNKIVGVRRIHILEQITNIGIDDIWVRDGEIVLDTCINGEVLTKDNVDGDVALKIQGKATNVKLGNVA